MPPKTTEPVEAYRKPEFLGSVEARPLRILAEYLEPQSRFAELGVSDTIVFMGSARLKPMDEAKARLRQAQKRGRDVAQAETGLAMARYYEAARELAKRLTQWSKGLERGRRRFVVCTGGGPGVMEAANRGASEAKGINMGLNISIPEEQHDNPYITRELAFNFHYFFMRKFWFIYLAKAVVFFPGGFGTLDEFFEVLTLVQTRKLTKPLPIVLFGEPYWREVVDLEAMVRYGCIDEADLGLVFRTDSVDAAFDHVTRALAAYALKKPGGSL